MREEQVAAVREVAASGIDFDGLTITETADGYQVAREQPPRETERESLRSTLEPVSDHVTNWYYWHAGTPQKADRWAFLRWIEDAESRPVQERYDAMAAEGLQREWGQLRISVTLADDGQRRYELRHEADATRDSSALEQYEDPSEARDIARFDDDRQYRPLKSAPTLPTGWVFPDLGPEELLTAVEYIYPATVANWHREREGNLDVSHWHETMARQTGMYGLIETWDRGEGHEHVEWVAEACCDDSQCLKRREWEYDAETPLSVDGGNGEFPCREPCSLVVAAARKWTKLESEQPSTYSFELTESELEQLGEIVDAVAEGRSDAIRDADVSDGANRYRARFLRAKLFEDGELPPIAGPE
jgi:hypothetical protein